MKKSLIYLESGKKWKVSGITKDRKATFEAEDAKSEKENPFERKTVKKIINITCHFVDYDK